MTKPDGRRPKRRRGVELPEPGRCLIEDVDGVTCVLRTSTPLTDDERQALRAFVERVLLNVDREAVVDITVPDLLRVDTLDETTVWLDKAQPRRTPAAHELHPDTSTWDQPL